MSVATTALTEWPSEDLEHLDHCPACGDHQRRLLFDDMTDLSYGVAPGTWRMWQCEKCTAAYLDPRPDERSISRAYKAYYTHEPPQVARLRAFICGNGVRTHLRAGYYNARFGYRLKNGWPLASVYSSFMPAKKSEWSHFIRHLPPPSGAGAALLDVGCGSGRFLVLAKALGYMPIGLEPDPEAAAVARSTGAEVRQGLLPNGDLPAAFFEQITLSHVFEHLHRPREAVQELLEILKPGGRVWFTQPNLDATGRDIFGKYWRGFEVPRHLCLFNNTAFIRFLQEAGFRDVKVLPPPLCAADYFRTSLSMMERTIPGENVIPAGWNSKWQDRAHKADTAASRAPEKAESVTIVASKGV